MKKQTIFMLFYIIGVNTLCNGQNDTCKVYFKLNIDAVDKKAREKIDSLVYGDMINSASKLLIVGYADFLGTEEHNQGLSERRSNNVRTYLKTVNILDANIKSCIGKGEIDRTIKLPEGYASDRRVDIVIQHFLTKSVKKNTTITATAKPNKISFPQMNVEEVKVGEAFRLQNIYFYISRHIVTEESYPQLDILYAFLEKHPDIKIQIEGHVCCVKNVPDAEDEDTNEISLSVNRAKYIYEYLAQKGVNKNRMRYIGYGISRPLIWPERSTKDEEMNRRVEIRILEK